MPLLTTTIGSYPKPDYTPVPGWFAIRDRHRTNPTEAYSAFLADTPKDAQEAMDRATREVVDDGSLTGCFQTGPSLQLRRGHDRLRGQKE